MTIRRLVAELGMVGWRSIEMIAVRSAHRPSNVPSTVTPKGSDRTVAEMVGMTAGDGGWIVLPNGSHTPPDCGRSE
jgi:hypothetical protein